jgi:hypothetical protein
VANERKWAEGLAAALEPLIQARAGVTIHATTEDLIRHSMPVMGYTPDQVPQVGKTDVEFTTDMLIWEDLHGDEGTGWLPRIVVEVKFFALSAHDAFGFQAKAERHRQVFPYLRTALLLPGIAALPPRLPLLAPFDLMLSWPRLEWDDGQLGELAALLAEEVEASRRLEQLLAERGKGKQRLVRRRFETA